MKTKTTVKKTVAGQSTGVALLTKDEVAVRLHIHPDTVLRWARMGLLPGERVGKTWLFDWVKIEVELLHGKSTKSTR